MFETRLEFASENTKIRMREDIPPSHRDLSEILQHKDSSQSMKGIDLFAMEALGETMSQICKVRSGCPV